MPRPQNIAPLKPGYKQTEVGVIPADWVITPFCELMDFRNGVNADKEAYGTGIRFVNVLEAITHSHLCAGDIPGRVTLPKSAIDSFSIRKADLVFNRTSETQEEVGLASVYLDDEDVVFGGFVIRGRPKTDSLDPAFAGYALRSPRIRSQVVSKGQGAIRANIGQTDLRQVLAILPPLPEQRAIAAALGDVDALIGALDRLIAKKRDLKQAAMQQLLTGQTRLPGFQGAWDHVRLGDLFSFKNGLNKSKEFFGHGKPIVNYMDVFGSPVIHSASLKGRVSLTTPELKNFDVRKGDVFFTRTSETTEEVGVASVVLDEPADTVFSGFVLRARPLDDRLTHRFNAYCFGTALVRKQITSKASYTTRALTNGRSLSEVELPLPTPLEQTAIAAVLSDMDAEIATLEARRDKTRLLKQGMMQELLTGKTRLI
jgi:type I restriction enzyme S subunit